MSWQCRSSDLLPMCRVLQVLCLGLATALAAVNNGAAWRGAPMEVGNALLGAFVRGRENSGVVLRRLWAEALLRELVTRAVVRMCGDHEALAANMSRALDIFQACPHRCLLGALYTQRKAA